MYIFCDETRGGVFLLEDGQNMWLWIGKAASPDFLSQLLGVPTLDNVDTTQVKFTCACKCIRFVCCH